MATTVSGNKIQPAVDMNQMHWDVFTFKQKREANPKRVISSAFCLYGEDINGERVFDTQAVGVNTDDADTLVVSNAVANGQTPEEFMIEYEAKKASIIADYLAGNIKDTDLMVYFELFLGRIAELNGKATITGIE